MCTYSQQTRPAAAVTLNVNANGILTGASGVTVATAAGTKTYNVEFLGGSCATLFTDCGASDDAARPFAFVTIQDAEGASAALLDQVFRDVSKGSFDSEPGLTRGCRELILCLVFTPFRAGPETFLQSSAVFNVNEVLDCCDQITFDLGRINQDTAELEFATFARWTEVTPIPLPAGAPLVLSGLAAFGALRWRNRRERRRAQV